MASTLQYLQKFNEYFYRTFTEILLQQTDLFNAASNGTITLSAADAAGDFSDAAFWALVEGLVQHRDVNSNADVETLYMRHALETAVRLARRGGPVALNPSDMRWINVPAEERAAALAQQMAKTEIAELLNTALISAKTALESEPEVVRTIADYPTLRDFNRAAGLFGDNRAAIQLFVMHSDVHTEIWDQTLQNVNGLFSFGDVTINSDASGKRFLVSDSPALISTGAGGAVSGHNTLGLATGAIMLGRNSDYDENYDTRNGKENIIRNWQSEWSWNMALRGFSYVKSQGANPNNATLAARASWSRNVTQRKALAGVLLKSAVPAA